MKKLFFAVALVLVAPGCTQIYLGVQNTCYEAQYYYHIKCSEARHRAMAKEVLAHCEDRKSASHDYKCGFVHGYAGYLDLGGTGMPPPVPPQHFWTDHYFNPDHYQAMCDWYEGHRDGVTAAVQSGCRSYELVPSPLCCCQGPAGTCPPPILAQPRGPMSLPAAPQPPVPMTAPPYPATPEPLKAPPPQWDPAPHSSLLEGARKF
jgi:hypothetical protein